MVRIRLQRFGRHGRPFYRIVAIDQRRKREGRALEILGTYDPLTDPITVKVDRARFDAWIARGALPSDPVRMIVLGEKLKKKRRPKKGTKEKKQAAEEEKPQETKQATSDSEKKE